MFYRRKPKTLYTFEKSSVLHKEAILGTQRYSGNEYENEYENESENESENEYEN